MPGLGLALMASKRIIIFLECANIAFRVKINIKIKLTLRQPLLPDVAQTVRFGFAFMLTCELGMVHAGRYRSQGSVRLSGAKPRPFLACSLVYISVSWVSTEKLLPKSCAFLGVHVYP